MNFVKLINCINLIIFYLINLLISIYLMNLVKLINCMSLIII